MRFRKKGWHKTSSPIQSVLGALFKHKPHEAEVYDQGHILAHTKERLTQERRKTKDCLNSFNKGMRLARGMGDPKRQLYKPAHANRS